MAGEREDRDGAEQIARLADQKRTGVVTEFVAFLMDNKKWWLLPIVITLLLVGLLVIFGSSAAAPFIYTLF